MKVLKAQRHPDGINIKVELFDPKELILFPHINWLEKRMPKFRQSISSTGMLYPIIVTDLEHYWHTGAKWPRDEKGDYILGRACHTGNKRVLWARENNYDLIEGYYVKHINEKNRIISQTYLHKDKWPVRSEDVKRN